MATFPVRPPEPDFGHFPPDFVGEWRLGGACEIACGDLADSVLRVPVKLALRMTGRDYADVTPKLGITRSLIPRLTGTTGAKPTIKLENNAKFAMFPLFSPVVFGIDVLIVPPHMARRPSQDINLTAVAKRLNLAISTVSRAMRNAEGVHAETRTRVLEAAKSMGYDFSRRNPPEFDAQPHYIMAMAQCGAPQSDQRYLTGMSRASVTLNLAILSHHATVEECENVLDPRYQPAALKAGLVEGLVLIHRWPTDVAAQLSQKWPTVSIVHHYADTQIDHVGIDDRTGVAVLMDHLRKGGHTRIGFFGLCRQMSWACSRFSAYVESLMRLGLSYEPRNVFEISLEAASTPTPFDCQDQLGAILGRVSAGVDAWVCSSSACGYSLCRGFLNRGLRIPDDVAVVGYHQNQPGASDLPLMTSTAVADEELGAAALRRLLHRFSHPDESQRSVPLPARFAQGETTRKLSTVSS